MNHHKEVAGRLSLAISDLRVATLDAAKAGDYVLSKEIEDVLVQANFVSKKWREKYERLLK